MVRWYCHLNYTFVLFSYQFSDKAREESWHLLRQTFIISILSLEFGISSNYLVVKYKTQFLICNSLHACSNQPSNEHKILPPSAAYRCCQVKRVSVQFTKLILLQIFGQTYPTTVKIIFSEPWQQSELKHALCFQSDPEKRVTENSYT